MSHPIWRAPSVGPAGKGQWWSNQYNAYPTQNNEFNDNYNAQYNWIYIPNANAQAVVDGIISTEQSPQWDGTPYPAFGIGLNSNTFICIALQASGTMLNALWFTKGSGSPLATRTYPFLSANGAKCID